jgi:hypothetical protein
MLRSEMELVASQVIEIKSYFVMQCAFIGVAWAWCLSSPDPQGFPTSPLIFTCGESATSGRWRCRDVCRLCIIQHSVYWISISSALLFQFPSQTQTPVMLFLCSSSLLQFYCYCTSIQIPHRNPFRVVRSAVS